MNETLTKLVRLLMALLVTGMAYWGHILFESTVVPRWIPMGVAGILAVSTIRLSKRWRVLTSSSNNIANVICHLVCVVCVGCWLVMASNYYLRDKENPQEVAVSITERHAENKERQNKIGKHRYRTTIVRKYYIEVVFGDGTVKKLDVSHAFYDAVQGDILPLVLEKGLWGFPVITNLSVKD